MRFRVPALVSVAVAALAAPTAGAHAPPNTPQATGTDPAVTDRADARNGVSEVGFHNLGNTGFNTDVWGHVTQDDRLFAYSGTWGIFTSGADPGQACPSETDNPAAPTKSGVKIVDVTDPAQPKMAARVASAPGAQNNDVKVERVTLADGKEIDLLVHSLEPCGAEGLTAQVAGPPITDAPTPQTGFVLYDVSDPEQPKRLGSYHNGGLGTHNLYIFENAGKPYVAAVYNEVGLLSDIYGSLQIVDVSNPASPTRVSEWDLETAGQACEARGVDSSMCYLHDVWLNADGTKAYLSYWDAGLVLLDVTDPSGPVFIGRANQQVQSDDPEGWLNEEGNTHAAVPLEVGGKEMVLVGDEDFTGGPSNAVKVKAPAELATTITEVAHWSGSAALTGQTGEAVYGGSGCTPASYAGADVRGKIVLVDDRQSRTNPADKCRTYLFAQKVQTAEKMGAIGLISIADNEEPFTGYAITGDIPAVEIKNSAGSPLADAVINGTTVEIEMGRSLPVDPWGFGRMVDVSDPDPAQWREVSQVKAPYVDTVEQPEESVFTAHNPIVGDDGRVYFAWYTNGLRVFEPQTDGTLTETASFVPLPSDHPDDLDQDPHGAQEDNFGFWGSYPVCHPRTGEQLILNSDLNRGLYVLRLDGQTCGASTAGPAPGATGAAKRSDKAGKAAGPRPPKRR